MLKGRIRKILDVTLASWITGLVLVLLAFLQFLYPLQILVQDLALTGYDPGNQIVILGIDDQALEKYGSWPWSRDRLGQVAKTLDNFGARTAVYDILLSDSRPGDSDLAATFSSLRLSTVLATKLDDTGNPVALTEELQNLSKVSLGLANLPRDSDGKVRHFDVLTKAQGQCMTTLGARAALIYLNQKLPDNCKVEGWQAGRTEFDANTNNIDFAGRSGTIRTISAADLENTAIMQEVRNKIVFIGSTIQDLKLGLDDNILTPYGLMPGVEIQANIANQMLLGRNLRSLPVWLDLGLMVVLLGLMNWVAVLIRPWQSSLLTLGLAAGTYWLTLLLRQSGWLIGLPYACLGLLAGWLLGLIQKFYLQNREHEYLKQVFGQYTDKQLLKKILEQGSVSLQGEKKFMSVLFTDLRNFTALTESTEPERLAALLNDYFTHSAQQIFATQGIVDKFIGDAIMSLWNAILEDPEHAYHACQAGVMLVSTIQEFNRKNGTYLYNGVGIATGNMIVGNLGSQSRFEYTAIGDRVNLASRLEALTKKYAAKILIDDATYEELDRLGKLTVFAIRHVDTVQVKGRLSEVKIYEIMADRFPEVDSQAIRSWYAQAFKLYEKGEFEQARLEFQQLGAQYRDQTSVIMSRRCKELIQEPPEDWRGVWSWQEK